MVSLLVVLLLLSLGALAVGLAKPSLLKQPSRKRSGLIFGGTTIVFFILLAIVSPKTPANPIAAEQSTAKTENAPDATVPVVASSSAAPAQPTPAAPTQTDQQKLEANLGSIVAKFSGSTKVSYKDMDIQSEASDPSRPKGAQMLVVGVNVSTFYNRSSFIKDAGKLSAALFQASYSSYLAPYDVVVDYYAETTDRYGNKDDSVVATYSIDKTTYAKINWSNFDASGLCDFLQTEMKLDDDGPVCTILSGLQ